MDNSGHNKSVVLAKNVPEEAVGSLRKLGYTPVFTRECPYFDTAVAFHPDLIICRHSSGGFLAWDGIDGGIRELLGDNVTWVSFDKDASNLSNEGKLNVLDVGKYRFANRKYCADIILPPSFVFIHVNQVYCACSSIPVDEGSVITDDPSIKKAAEAVGLAVLFVSKGDVSLPGHPYGFIGGSCVRLDGKIGFFGELASHRDGKAVRDFIESRGIEVVELCGGRLRDLGGGVLI